MDGKQHWHSALPTNFLINWRTEHFYIGYALVVKFPDGMVSPEPILKVEGMQEIFGLERDNSAVRFCILDYL